MDRPGSRIHAQIAAMAVHPADEVPGPTSAWSRRRCVVGTSVDEQKRVRIAGTPSPNWPATSSSGFPSNHFGALQFDDLSMFDWVVIGSPDGHTPARWLYPSLGTGLRLGRRHLPKGRKAGCKVHFKPNLINGKSPDWVGMRFPDEYQRAARWDFRGSDWTQFPPQHQGDGTGGGKQVASNLLLRSGIAHAGAHGTDGYIPTTACSSSMPQARGQ